VHIPVLKDAEAGKYEHIITVTCGKEKYELKLSFTVYGVLIPPVGPRSWPVTNWFSYENMAVHHGLRLWSEAHWAMIQRYADLMVRNRQNTFHFSFKDVFTKGKTGLTLNRSRLRRIVKTFTRAGMYYIEGGHFGKRSTDEWQCPTFSILLTEHPATSAEGNADICGAARQLMDEIDRNKWRGRYLQHIADEPIGENATDYRIFVGIVRKYMPGIPIIDATMDKSLAGSLDIWCPQAQHYQNDRQFLVLLFRSCCNNNPIQIYIFFHSYKFSLTNKKADRTFPIAFKLLLTRRINTFVLIE